MKLVHLVGFIIKKFVTMYSHVNVKCVKVVPKLRSLPPSGSRDGFMENSIIMNKSKFVSKFKQNYREKVIIGSVLINFKHTVAIKF